MRIGVFGGTFDPYTVAHAAIADVVLGSGAVDKIVIVPTVVDWHRPGKEKWLKPAEKLDCIRLISGMSPYAERIEVDGGELNIPEQLKKNRRFVHTLARLTFEYGIENDYFTVIGGDSYEQFGSWWRYKSILEMSDIICVNMRDGVDVSARMPKWKPTDTFVSIGNEYAGISATGIRKKFAGTGGINAYIAEITEGKRETAA